MTISSLMRRMLPATWAVRRLPESNRRRVLLTFDDGPSRQVTPEVLQRLDRYEARAVFFVVGRRVLRAPDVLRQIAAAGHVIGNHSFAHDAPRALSVAACTTDLKRAQETIQDFTGITPSLYRPPLGRINPATLLAARRGRMTLVHWSLETNDWRCRSAEDARRTARMILADAADRDVILLHDDNPYVVDVLDAILPELAERFDLGSAAELFESPAALIA